MHSLRCQARKRCVIFTVLLSFVSSFASASALAQDEKKSAAEDAKQAAKAAEQKAKLEEEKAKESLLSKQFPTVAARESNEQEDAFLQQIIDNSSGQLESRFPRDCLACRVRNRCWA